MKGSGDSAAKRKTAVQDKEPDGHAEQHGEIVEHGHNARGEKIVERVHVGCGARHQAAHRGAVEETHRQALQMLEDFLAQVVHRFLADPLHDAHLQILQGETGEQRNHEEATLPRQDRSSAELSASEPENPGTMYRSMPTPKR